MWAPSIDIALQLGWQILERPIRLPQWQINVLQTFNFPSCPIHRAYFSKMCPLQCCIAIDFQLWEHFEIALALWFLLSIHAYPYWIIQTVYPNPSIRWVMPRVTLATQTHVCVTFRTVAIFLHGVLAMQDCPSLGPLESMVPECLVGPHRRTRWYKEQSCARQYPQSHDFYDICFTNCMCLWILQWSLLVRDLGPVLS